MLASESLAWNWLQAIRSRLLGRLAWFTRKRARDDRPNRLENDAALIETDLRYILKPTQLPMELSKEDFDEFVEMTENLLTSLNEMVNEDLINSSGELSCQGYESPEAVGFHNDLDRRSHEIEMLGDRYENLGALLRFLDISTGKFNLASGPNPSLFILPHRAARARVINHVTEWILFSERFVADTLVREGFRTAQSSAAALVTEPPEDEADMLWGQTSPVVGAIFRQFQMMKCGKLHEIKLQVSEEVYPSQHNSALDMFISCCLHEDQWHEAQCESFQTTLDHKYHSNICEALDKSRQHRRKLRLHVDDTGLFDISDKLPRIPISQNDQAMETLDSLLQHEAFSQITWRNHRDLKVTERFGAKEKASLALALGRCLMDFFDHDFIPDNWSSENIFFLRSALKNGKSRLIYVLLRPKLPAIQVPCRFKSVEPGNPVLLSFAKLLLEIEEGRKIDMDIKPECKDNLLLWAELCGFLNEAKNNRNSCYLEAVHGCLYLHVFKDNSSLVSLKRLRQENGSFEVKEVIYERIVHKLELEVNPQGLKRKRPDSFPEDSPVKRPISSISFATNSRCLQEQFTGSAAGWNPSFGMNMLYGKVLDSSQYTQASASIQCPEAFRLPGRARKILSRDYTNQNIGHNYLTPDWRGSPNMKKLSRDDYTIGWICALPVEMVAARAVLDVTHASLGQLSKDSNTYTLGEINGHNVVIACLPSGVYGTTSAALVAKQMDFAFPNIQFGLMVGIGGGVPTAIDIRLGDVVVSNPTARSSGVVQYDYGKTSTSGIFEETGTLNKPPSVALTGSSTLQSIHMTGVTQIPQFLSEIAANVPTMAYPGQEYDQLFQAEYAHEGSNKSYQECDWRKLVPRKNRDTTAPHIHYGLIASGNEVMRNGQKRDQVAEKRKILCFEMEAAGLQDHFPCLVIRGICDYSDSHKNKQWQPYAAATAAAYTKELLKYIPVTGHGTPRRSTS